MLLPDSGRGKPCNDVKTPSNRSEADQQIADSVIFPVWPPAWPEISESINRVVQSGDWGRYRGRATAELIGRITDICGVRHGRLVSSGSLGVELALRGVGISPNQAVAVCGYDYPGNFRAIELLGARPVLVDADPSGFSIDPEQLDLVSADAVKAVLVSHLYGVPAQMQSIREICDRNGWALIEDACQTPGMDIQGRPAGTWGEIGVLSFGGSKPLTAGNGGALLTNMDAIASKLNAWLDRPSDSTPLSELQAAALLPQLDRLDECNRIRWETCSEIVKQNGWIGSAAENSRLNEKSTFYKFAFLSQHRDLTLGAMHRLGLPVGPGYRSMHRSSDRRCDKIGTLNRCRMLGEQVCLLDHAALLSTGRQRTRLVELLAVATG